MHYFFELDMDTIMDKFGDESRKKKENRDGSTSATPKGRAPSQTPEKGFHPN